ncbi:MAG: hypothetical protein ACRD97_10660 [Nitrososphaeraceae archaeon]
MTYKPLQMINYPVAVYNKRTLRQTSFFPSYQIYIINYDTSPIVLEEENKFDGRS